MKYVTSNDSLKMPEGLRDSRRKTTGFYSELCERDGQICSIEDCNETIGLQVDHIIPWVHGGKSTLDNSRLLCEYHNAKKADFMPFDMRSGASELGFREWLMFYSDYDYDDFCKSDIESRILFEDANA
jgi:hypothetical protein